MLIKLGSALRKVREGTGASLETVAGPAGISAAYLHKLERGVVDNPSPRVLARLAAALGISYLRLMKLAGYLNEKQLAQARLHGASSHSHPLAGQKLTPEEWREVAGFIKTLLGRRNAESTESDSSS